MCALRALEFVNFNALTETQKRHLDGLKRELQGHQRQVHERYNNLTQAIAMLEEKLKE